MRSYISEIARRVFMQVTGKTKTGEEKQLTVEIRDVEIVYL
ncbi:hypothetical protein [Lactococcus lactis]|nr:hypothetical protein [Lactococcus lactis]